MLFHPSVNYMSYSHTKEDVQQTLEACNEALRILKKAVDEKNVKGYLEGEVAKPVFTSSMRQVAQTDLSDGGAL